MGTSQQKAVIIGAGPAGLTAALEFYRKSSIRPMRRPVFRITTSTAHTLRIMPVADFQNAAGEPLMLANNANRLLDDLAVHPYLFEGALSLPL